MIVQTEPARDNKDLVQSIREFIELYRGLDDIEREAEQNGWPCGISPATRNQRQHVVGLEKTILATHSSTLAEISAKARMFQLFNDESEEPSYSFTAIGVARSIIADLAAEGADDSDLLAAAERAVQLDIHHETLLIADTKDEGSREIEAADKEIVRLVTMIRKVRAKTFTGIAAKAKLFQRMMAMSPGDVEEAAERHPLDAEFLAYSICNDILAMQP